MTGLYNVRAVFYYLAKRFLIRDSVCKGRQMISSIRVLFENISGGLVMAGTSHDEMVFSRVSLKEYISYFKTQSPDILSLCEVHMEDEQGNSEMVDRISAELNLPFYKCYSQSPSHLDTSKYMGLAVLSRYPIEEYSTFLLPNPKLRVLRPDGTQWVMFDKGAQKLTLRLESSPLMVINLHYFPFHHFSHGIQEPQFSRVRRRLVNMLLKDTDIPTVITGDFNNKSQPLPSAFPELFENGHFLQAVVAETTVVGLSDEQFDHILYTPDTLSAQHGYAERNYSDHFAVIADFVFR